MTVASQRTQHLFVVRVWWEPSEATQAGVWRGQVEHAPSGQRQYFTELEELLTLIGQRLTPDPLSDQDYLAGS